MKFGSAGPLTRPGRQLAGFLILSLGAHAAAFSLFRDPGDFAPIPPPSPGQVVLVSEAELPAGYAHIFDPSAIVYPQATPSRLAAPVVLPWQDAAWAGQPTAELPPFRSFRLGADAPLAVRAEQALGEDTGFSLFRSPAPRDRPVAATWHEIIGDLKDRKPSAKLDLPGMKSGSALEPTTARIGVDEDGAVRFVFLEGTSGDPAVDREASNLLRSWRFEPAPGRWVEWGRVRILWRVDPPGEEKP